MLRELELPTKPSEPTKDWKIRIPDGERLQEITRLQGRLMIFKSKAQEETIQAAHQFYLDKRDLLLPYNFSVWVRRELANGMADRSFNELAAGGLRGSLIKILRWEKGFSDFDSKRGS